MKSSIRMTINSGDEGKKLIKVINRYVSPMCDSSTFYLASNFYGNRQLVGLDNFNRSRILVTKVERAQGSRRGPPDVPKGR